MKLVQHLAAFKGYKGTNEQILGNIPSATFHSLTSNNSSLVDHPEIVFMCRVKVREMLNVLVLPRSADYSEEVWMEIREKAISILQTYFLDGVVPIDAVSDEEEESDITNENEHSDRQRMIQSPVVEQLAIESSAPESSQRKGPGQLDSPSNHLDNSARSEGKRSRSSKKAKKRHARQKSQQKLEDALERERERLLHNRKMTLL